MFVFVLPRIADYRDVWDVLRELGWEDWLLLAGATVLNLVTFAPPWMVALPGLGFRQAFVLTQASTALSMVSPAGAAVGMAGSYSMLRSWGFRAGAVALAVAVTGIWNQFANLAFPIVGARAAHGGVTRTIPRSGPQPSSGVGVLVVAIVGVRARPLERAAARAGSAISRPRCAPGRSAASRRAPRGWDGESLVRFREGALGLLRRRWHVLTLATLVGPPDGLPAPARLPAGRRASPRREISWIEAFAAWSLVRILGALPLTPGGVGIVELGLSGALVAFGASNADAVAATLLYRALTVLPTLGLGMFAAATWRTHHPGDRLESNE